MKASIPPVLVAQPVINEAKRMRQEAHKFEVSLGYTLKKRKKERKHPFLSPRYQAPS
jgi:hypothetical protein